jgi:oxygen-independent coproporphyrinogen-3 oxidase
MTTVPISRELLDQYNKPGPRYTSYPTVPFWSKSFGEAEYRQALGTLAARPDDVLSLYVHLPFCAERCYYCGCNATVTNRESVVDTYLDRVEREVGMVVDIIGQQHPVAQLHLGGGTPNFLSGAQLHRLYGLLDQQFAIDAAGEISIEIDPRIATREGLETIRALGFNRISLGVQDFEPAVQEAIGRHQPESLTREIYHLCRELDFTSVNLDMVYGLPGQTELTFEHTLRTVIELDPDRIACFSYAHLPNGRPNQKRVDTTSMPDHYQKFDLFLMAIDRLTEAGYDWIGMDHFGRREDELAQAARERRLHRNFMGYTTRPAPHQLAFGMSGIGDLADSFVQNDAKLGDYQKALDAGRLPVVRGMQRSRDDRLRRSVIMHMMCNLELPYNLTVEEFGVDVREALGPELQRMTPYINEGFLTLEPQRMLVTPLGRFFIRNICMEFDAYLHTSGDKPLFSKTI